ncbi:MAG: hypothetical protein ACXVCY_18245 [Pseudobdellovibrionaceae bacterium]
MKFLITAIIILTGFMVQAAPGMIAKTTISVFRKPWDPGRNVLAEALKNYEHVKFIQIKLNDSKSETGDVYPPGPVNLFVAFEPREDPDSSVGTNFIIVEGYIFQVEGLDINSIEKVGEDLLKLSGSAGYYLNDQEESCGNFSGVDRELVIKFSRDSNGLKATVVSQKDTKWCHL